MFTKKIMSILLISILMIFSIFPICNASSKPLLADCVVGNFSYVSAYYTKSSGVVTEKYYNQSEITVNNGENIRIICQYPDAQKTVLFCELCFTFADDKYLIGQTYDLSFSTNISNSNYIYVYGYYFNIEPIPVLAAGTNTIENCKTVGSNNVAPYQFNSYFTNQLDMSLSRFLFNGRVTSSQPFYMQLSLTEDTLPVSKNIYYYLIIHVDDLDNFSSDLILQNVSLVPTGSTKFLYADKEFQQNIEQDLSDINQGIDDTNDKLDEIINQPEQEKQDAEDSANNSINSIIDGIENKGPGFFNAIQDLVQALSYNGTESKWNFPEVKLPKIEGAWEELVLIQSQEIDFNFWFDRIPEVIINLARAFSTILLVIFCFRELYSTIQYVMTLRGGG